MAFDIMNSIDPREVIKLPLDLIKPNKNNPYIKDEHLEKIIAIKASILDEGLNNPIVVEDTEDGYVINKGHSRYYAYQLINQEQITGYEEIECYITSFDDEASSLRSLMRDNATQKERTVQDKCREVKLYLEKVIPVIRDLPVEKKATLTAEIPSNFIKKTINELEKNDKTNKKTEIKEINDNHIILLKDNLLAITHCKGNDPLKTEFNMYSGSKLIIECFYKLGRIKISWQSNNESYYKTVNIASYIDIETAVVVLMKISCATYTYIINEIITDCYLRNESKYKDIDNMADKCIEIVKLLQKKGIRSDL